MHWGRISARRALEAIVAVLRGGSSTAFRADGYNGTWIPSLSPRASSRFPSRASNTMEERYEGAEDAASLEQCARGEISRAELDRRLRTDLMPTRE